MRQSILMLLLCPGILSAAKGATTVSTQGAAALDQVLAR
jgi:hypothetical protein